MTDDFVFQLDASIDDGNSVYVKTLICTSNFSYIIKEIFSILMDNNFNRPFIIDVTLKCWTEGKIVNEKEIITWQYSNDYGGEHRFHEEEFRCCVPKDYKQEFLETIMSYKLLNMEGKM